jgi:hypothetical protein
MKTLSKWVAALFFHYGIYSAGIPSYHGTFEAKVPEQLVKISQCRQ